MSLPPPPPADPGRPRRRGRFSRGVAIAVACIVLVYAVVMAAVVVTRRSEAARIRADLHHLIDATPPTGVVACTTGPTPHCAALAAARTHCPVAWMSPPGGFTFRDLVAVPVPSCRPYAAYEDFRALGVWLELVTDPLEALDYNGRVLMVRTVDGISVTVYRNRDPSAPPSLWAGWTRAGHAYELVASPPGFTDAWSEPSPSAMLDWVGTVGYATPH